MSLLRVLSVSAFASIGLMSASAQSPAAPKLTTPTTPSTPSTPFSSPYYTFPKTFTVATPQLFRTTPLLTKQTPPPAPSDVAKAMAGLAALEKTHTTTSDACFTMRSYGFTAGDLHSSTPTQSSYSTCTPAHAVTLKDATTTPSK